MRNVSVQQTNAVHVPHERQERRPHKEFTTACNIHLISNKKTKEKKGEKKGGKQKGKKGGKKGGKKSKKQEKLGKKGKTR